jgi:hypothetical protein
VSTTVSVGREARRTASTVAPARRAVGMPRDDLIDRPSAPSSRVCRHEEARVRIGTSRWSGRCAGTADLYRDLTGRLTRDGCTNRIGVHRLSHCRSDGGGGTRRVRTKRNPASASARGSKLFMISAKKGADTILYLAASPEVERPNRRLL